MRAQVASTLVGLWVMIAPSLLGFGSVAANNGHIIGPVVLTFAVVAYWEATRAMRKWNYPLGAWLLLAPWVLQYSVTAAIFSDMLSGLLILIFSSIRGKQKNEYGGGWSSLAEKRPQHEKLAEEKNE